MTPSIKSDIFTGSTFPDVLAMQTLEHCYKNKMRIRIYFGDNYKIWHEINSTTGYIGRSIGTDKIALLINNKRSYGGGAILTDYIIGIQNTNTKAYLYETSFLHPELNKYHLINNSVYHGKDLIANFNAVAEAKKFLEFMQGKRMAK